MRFRSKHAAKIAARSALTVAYIAAVVGPILAFAAILRADGPIAALAIWAGSCALAIWIAATKGTSKAGSAVSAIGVALAALLCAFGIFAILVQLGVTRRSLAEAWLELAREGRAFGFFSFFAAEVYAIFSIVVGAFLAKKRFLGAATFACSANALSAGIIMGSAPLIALASALAFILAAVSGAEEPGKPGFLTRFAATLRAALFPAALAIAISLGLVALSSGSANLVPELPTPDFSPIVAKIAPSLPLLREIPGYGIAIDGGEMPRAVILSDRKLFRISGKPGAVEYLASSRYARWDGAEWTEDPDQGDALLLSDQRPLRGRHAIELELVEDFYPIIPIPADATRFAIEKNTVGAVHSKTLVVATANRGIRFSPSAKYGLKVAIASGDSPQTGIPPTPDKSRAEETELSQYGAEGSTISPRIATLARTIRRTRQAGERLDLETVENRSFLSAALEYLDRNYTYSLETGSDDPKGNNLEYFLFKGKKGFCLYFASAFVLLARAEGIPARLVEGYRIELDERGTGTITGNHAHAWAEVWIDGRWEQYDPTPVYQAGNPYDRIDRRDKTTKKHLEALFGAQPEDGETRSTWSPSREAIRIASLSIMIAAMAAALIVLLLRRAESDDRKTTRLARKLVRRGYKKGVERPEIIGWKEWGQRAETAIRPRNGTVDRFDDPKRPARVAEAMLLIAFGPTPAREDRRALRKRPFCRKDRHRR